MKAVLIEHFRKRFPATIGRRPHLAVEDIGFQVDTGQVYGFLGPNGAGKTTTIKALLGLIRADQGRLEIFGHPPDSPKWRRRVGYLPEHPAFYPYLTGLETATMFGCLSGLSNHDARTSAERLLHRVGLGHALDRKLSKYSKGMLQRVGLASALVGEPELLILDEPLTGLDPVGRKELRDLFRELADEGRTVVYSTHILSDAESTCREVCIVAKGKVRYRGAIEGLGSANPTYGLAVDHEVPLPDSVTEGRVDLRNDPGRSNRSLLIFPDEASAVRALEAALSAGLRVVRFEPQQQSLEAFFMELVRSEPEARPGDATTSEEAA